jgi:hypothetical protein
MSRRRSIAPAGPTQDEKGHDCRKVMQNLLTPQRFKDAPVELQTAVWLSRNLHL